MINGRQEQAIIDTGARVSVASSMLYQWLRRKGATFTPIIADITLADGRTTQQTVCTVETTVNLAGKRWPVTFTILPDAIDNHTLLRIDFLTQIGILLNVPQRAWSMINDPSVWYAYDTWTSRPNQVTSITCRLETKSIATSPILPKHQMSSLSDSIQPIQNTLEKRARSFASPHSSKIPRKENATIISSPQTPKLTVNPYDNPFILPATFIPVSPLPATPSPARRHNIIKLNYFELALRDDEGSNLSPYQHKRLNDLLTAHEPIFAEQGPPTEHQEHRIDTGNEAPVASTPYRLTPEKRAVLRAELDHMAQAGIIEESDSPWASPVVLVPKKDGSIRVCIDYRKLNAITKPDRYPLPRIDDLLHDARSTKYMSTLDLRSGYWQIRVKPEDQEKTAFVTPFGMFQFRRMPFGLRNAPPTFQRLMDSFKNGLPQIHILAYLDDLIVTSDSFVKHINDLTQVFLRLARFNLRAHRSKCHFGCQQVRYLGHILTPDGIMVDPEKTSAILQRTAPTNLKQLTSFLQTCSWYRRFIPGFSSIIDPLSKLTRKNIPWAWSDEQNTNFNQLKNLLTTAPVLAQANGQLPFIIKTDASAFALGAVLVQGTGADEHPIEYASRLLIPAERNYSTIEREALAVVWALEKFRGYIEGQEINIITDHQPLKWLMTLKSPSGRLARWALKIQHHNLIIDYSPGKTNVIADGLSRPDCKEHNTDQCICTIHIDVPRRSAADTRTAQMSDPQLKTIIECFESAKPEDDELIRRWTHRGYLLNNGVLYRYSPEPETESDEVQLVIPVCEQKEILDTYHKDQTAGHYGYHRTLTRITSRYFWVGMRKDITDYVSKCVECQRYKATNLKPAGLIQTTASRQRFETIAIDLFGPLPKTPEGYRHIFIIEDLAARWVEIFPLKDATAEQCAKTLLTEIFMRFGLPRRILSDNGPQFISAVVQQLTYVLKIGHVFTPVYHPEANPVERKNRDMKPQLAILVGKKHTEWAEKLPFIRFAMNTARCASTGYTAAYLTFGRELRTVDDVNRDLRTIVQSENFVPEITPHLLLLADTLKHSQEVSEGLQDKNRVYSDPKRRHSPKYQIGDLVMVATHCLSKTAQEFSAKLAPRRDGPYQVIKRHGSTSYEIAHPDNLDTSLGVFHTSALTRYVSDQDIGQVLPAPVQTIRKRGRPRTRTTQTKDSQRLNN